MAVNGVGGALEGETGKGWKERNGRGIWLVSKMNLKNSFKKKNIELDWFVGGIEEVWRNELIKK